MVNTNLKSRLGVKVKAITGTEAETSETALVPVSSDYLALTGNALNIIQENLKHQPLSLQFFDIIKSPSGGATVFSVPGLTGDEPAKELTGIILDILCRGHIGIRLIRWKERRPCASVQIA